MEYKKTSYFLFYSEAVTRTLRKFYSYSHTAISYYVRLNSLKNVFGEKKIENLVLFRNIPSLLEKYDTSRNGES